MKDRTIKYYLELNNDNLLPSDSQVTLIKDEDWYKALKNHFNDLMWLYYSDRVVFVNDKFKIDMSDDETITNIIKSFAIYLKSKNYTYSKLYETTQLEYNPLWNVDGVTGTIHESTHTGTDTRTKKGDETLEESGTRTTEHTGSDTTEHDGDDTTTNSGTTMDSGSTFLDKDKSKTDYNSTSEITYDSTTELTDDHENTTTFDIEDKLTRNLKDVDLDLVIRQGNIGVTKSTELIDDQRDTVLFDFYKKVVRDCVNLITYAVD